MQDIKSFIITIDQQEALCKHFGKSIEDLADFEICELLDRLIDEECN